MTRTHWGQHTLDVCFGCRVQTVSVAPSAMPSRHPEAVATNAREARWHKDIPAYQGLVKNGVQPRQIDGCHDLAQTTAERFEISTGIAVPGKAQKQATKDALQLLGHGDLI